MSAVLPRSVHGVRSCLTADALLGNRLKCAWTALFFLLLLLSWFFEHVLVPFRLFHHFIMHSVTIVGGRSAYHVVAILGCGVWLMVVAMMLTMMMVSGARRDGTATVRRGGNAIWWPSTHGNQQVLGWGADPYGRRRPQVAVFNVGDVRDVGTRRDGIAKWGPVPYGWKQQRLVTSEIWTVCVIEVPNSIK